MAENANGQNLDKVGVEEVTQPQESQGEIEEKPATASEAGETEKVTEAVEQKPKDLETMSLDELEAEINRQSEPEVQTPEPALLQDEEEKPTRSDRRYQELARKNQELQARLDELQAQEQRRLQTELKLKSPPWEKDPAVGPQIKSYEELGFEAGQDVPLDVLNQKVLEKAEAIANEKVKAERLNMQAQMETQKRQQQFAADREYIARRYPQLDESSPHYSRELDEFIGEAAKNAGVTALGLRPFVDAIMAARGNADNRAQNAKRQASQAAITSTVSTSTGQAPDYMTADLDEMERQLGVI